MTLLALAQIVQLLKYLNYSDVFRVWDAIFIVNNYQLSAKSDGADNSHQRKFYNSLLHYSAFGMGNF